MSMDTIDVLPIGKVLTSAMIDGDRLGLTFRALDDLEDMAGEPEIIWIDAALVFTVYAEPTHPSKATGQFDCHTNLTGHGSDGEGQVGRYA